MKLHLIRHAHAEPIGTGLVRDDDDRALSARGRESAREVGDKLRELEVRFDRVLTSPLIRAVQTAEITAARTDFRGPVEACPFLARTGKWRDDMEGLLAGLLAPNDGRAADSVALFGHNPDLADLVTALLGIPAGTFAFPAGAVCRLELSSAAVDGRAHLEWWLDPGDLAIHERI